MPKVTKDETARTNELLEKLLVMRMHAMGCTQDQIARVVGRQKLWVNALLKKIPRKPE
jgi:hypothetical protein